MKILYDYQIFSHQNYGGPSRYYVQLAENLHELKHKPSIVAGFHLNEHLKEIKYKNIVTGKKILFSKIINKSNKLKKFIGNLNKNIFLKISKDKNPDVMHYTYFDNINDNINCKKIITVYDLIHEIFYDDYKKNKFYRPKKEIIQKADNIICISNSTKNDLIKYYNVDEKKIRVIYLGNNIKKIKNNYPKYYEKFLKLPYILFVGKREGYKNFDNLLKTFSENLSKLKDVYIVCFGGSNFSKKEIKKIRDLKLDFSKIIYVEGNDELISLFYQNARLFVYPSKYEGFGLPILESFTNECPVICSNTSSFPEVGGDAVSYFDPYKTDSIFESIYKTFYSDSFRNELILKGQSRNKLFTWKKTALDHLNLYKS
tara:strand:+ start:9474 stop:10586 length:1113 start_codon:yes stop_codon:yes gene_type:complete